MNDKIRDFKLEKSVMLVEAGGEVFQSLVGGKVFQFLIGGKVFQSLIGGNVFQSLIAWK